MEEQGYQDTNQKPSSARLFLCFLRLGATAFGGPAMVAYIRKVAVEEKRWMDEQTFRDGVALCQTIPGATAMQTSAYVGLRTRGMAGAMASFIGFGLPAFFIMMILSALYEHAYSLPAVVSAFKGLQVVVVAIVAYATVSFGRTSLKNWKDLTIVIVAAGMFWFRINPTLVILLAPLLGLVLYSMQRARIPTVHPIRKLYSTKSFLLILSAIAVGFFVLLLVERRLFDLAALMFRIDLFAFGGGFASVPLMFHEVVDVRSWMDGPTFLNGIALGQVTPGPIVITATFIGYLLYGPFGGVVATVSVFLPSFIILVGTVPYFDRLRGSPYFDKAIAGILSCFVGLLLTVTIRLALNVSWDVPRVLLASAAFVALFSKINILWVALVGAVISVLVYK